eukprot:scaffold603_cov404-Prasinococcus_capsulatus_cf.AAC.7
MWLLVDPVELAQLAHAAEVEALVEVDCLEVAPDDMQVYSQAVAALVRRCAHPSHQLLRHAKLAELSRHAQRGDIHCGPADVASF